MNLQIVKVDKNRVLKYIGETNRADVFQLIDHCEKQILNVCSPKIATFKLDEIPQSLIVGEDIKKHLENCFGIYVFCLTLGTAVDVLIRKAYYTDIFEQVVLDATSSVLVEQIAENFELELKNQFEKENIFTTLSYAPGYGDYPISLLKTYLEMVDSAKNVGVSLTDSGLMTPRKTICAVIGLSKNKVIGFRAGCENCKIKENCNLRKGGKSCVR